MVLPGRPAYQHGLYWTNSQEMDSRIYATYVRTAAKVIEGYRRKYGVIPVKPALDVPHVGFGCRLLTAD